jgi:hypothetical protein
MTPDAIPASAWPRGVSELVELFLRFDDSGVVELGDDVDEYGHLISCYFGPWALRACWTQILVAGDDFANLGVRRFPSSCLVPGAPDETTRFADGRL